MKFKPDCYILILQLSNLGGCYYGQNKIKRYMKRRLTDFVMLLSVVVAMSMVSCNSYKKVPYLQNSRDLDTLIQQASVYEPVIQPNDMLDIVINSELEQIEGIGAKSLNALLKRFKTVSNVRSAKVEELAEVVGLKRAQAIVAYFATPNE